MKSVIGIVLLLMSLGGCVHSFNSSQTVAFKDAVAACGAKPVRVQKDALRRVRAARWNACRKDLAQAQGELPN